MTTEMTHGGIHDCRDDTGGHMTAEMTHGGHMTIQR